MRASLVCTLFVVGSTFVPDHTHGICEQSSIQNEDICYYTNFTVVKTWPEARNLCRQLNMDLVSINTESEHNFIYNMIKNRLQNIWIGLHRKPGGTLKEYAWTDGSLSNFSKWSPGEPNNAQNKEECAEMYYKNGEWNDLPCSQHPKEKREIQRNFICQAKRLPVGPTRSNVTGPPYISHNQIVRLSCCTDGAYPGIDFQWDGVTCSNKTVTAQCSTCMMTSGKEQEGTIVTCTATNTRDRSIRTVATYKITIAYGPSKVSLSDPLDKHLRPEQTVNISCTAHEAFPGVQYTWTGVTCAQSEGSKVGNVCSFTPSESDDGKTVTCSAVNLRNTNMSRTASYKISMADGPSRILIFESLHMNMKAEQAVDLLCIAYDAFPGVTYTWSGITCAQNELLRDGSTCSFTPSESDYGKTVTCTAKNPRDTNLSRSATYKISIAGGLSRTYFYIIIGSIAGVIVLTIGVITAVMWKRNHQEGNAPDSHEAGNKREKGCNNYYEEMGFDNNVYELPDLDRRSQADDKYYTDLAVTCTPSTGKECENIYMNTDSVKKMGVNTKMTEVTEIEALYANA